ncbi:MAG: glycosyltransferase [Dysgonamonadaceae bacterium]|jgi:glycosyltransferase involved in cell wall biosynthesis|nr:glycosyltransferase [Dysgonamonadaceae bacterium]
MQHWQSYIKKQKPEYRQTQFPTDFVADVIIVIPCYNEPNIFETLHSLLNCKRPPANILVTIIVNSSERSEANAVIQNQTTYDEVIRFSDTHSTSDFRFFPLFFENLPKKHAGVGLARKVGMDLAIEHFYRNEKKRGIIISLDADCTVSENYLTGIFNAFHHNKKPNATVHNFHHHAENNDPTIEYAVRQYEMYIRYFSEMLKSADFPHFYHTIGSAFAASADAYVRVGGMGRQQGGEDFYFLQKVFALGGIAELNDVYVYPLARFSDRVPFGTGPALQKIIDEPQGAMRSYSAQSFCALKQFFELKDEFFKKDAEEIRIKIVELHPSLVEFIEENNFLEAIIDCNLNSATLVSFQKRFFHHFNAFKIIKFLNFAHSKYFEKENLSFKVSGFKVSDGGYFDPSET